MEGSTVVAFEKCSGEWNIVADVQVTRHRGPPAVLVRKSSCVVGKCERVAQEAEDFVANLFRQVGPPFIVVERLP